MNAAAAAAAAADDMDMALADEREDGFIAEHGRKSCDDGKQGGAAAARSTKLSRFRVAEANSDACQRRLVDITRDKPIKVVVRVALPVRDHPKFNFVGKLLGPKGNSLKRLQEETMTKMAILGKGSMRDRHKEEQLRSSGDPRFSHLSDELHVEVTAFASPAEAHARIAYALSEVRRFLVPDYNDEIRQEQMWEMRVLNRSSSPNNRGTADNVVDDHDNDHNDDDDDDDDDDNNNNNDHTSIDKNMEPRSSDVGSERSGDEPKFGPPRAQSRLPWTQAKASGAGQNDGEARCAPPQLPLETALLAAPLSAPLSGAALPQHPAVRGLKNKAVVALASPAHPAANLTMVGRRRCLLGGAAAYRTQLFMSPTKRTVLSILARAKTAQCKPLVSGYAPHPQPTAADVRLSSSLSDRWTLFVDS